MPADDFERQVESDTPPTVTALAEQGKKTKPVVELDGMDPQAFARATHVLGILQEFSAMTRERDPAEMAAGIQRTERARAREYVGAIDAWLDRDPN